MEDSKIITLEQFLNDTSGFLMYEIPAEEDFTGEYRIQIGDWTYWVVFGWKDGRITAYRRRELEEDYEFNRLESRKSFSEMYKQIIKLVKNENK